MITLTPAAAKQVRQSAREGKMEGMALRIAATRKPDGSIHYAMGFDDVGREQDAKFTSEGIEIVVAPISLDLVTGTTVDYVELEPGQYSFIFLNPNDPNYQPASPGSQSEETH